MIHGLTLQEIDSFCYEISNCFQSFRKLLFSLDQKRVVLKINTEQNCKVAGSVILLVVGRKEFRVRL